MVSPRGAGDADHMTHASSTSTLSTGRPLGLTWLGVAVPVAVVATLLSLISDQADDRAAGLVLFVLAGIGFALGAWILRSAHGRARGTSYAASALWLIGAVGVYPTQDFAVDVLWVAGVPAIGAVVTAAVAWGAARRSA